MKRPVAICLVLMLMLPTSMTVIAQDNSSLFARVERTLKDKESGWKLVNKRISKNNKYVSYGWRSDKSFVSILISVHASADETTRTYKGLPFDFEVVGLKMKALATVPNLGDENYLWKDSNHKRIFGIDFRKGNVVVHVSAPSIEIAKQFALHIADAIPATS